MDVVLYRPAIWLSEPVSNLKVYLIKGEETSSCGVAYLHNKIFSEEEKCCIALIRRALREGEKKIMQRFGTWEMKERE